MSQTAVFSNQGQCVRGKSTLGPANPCLRGGTIIDGLIFMLYDGCVSRVDHFFLMEIDPIRVAQFDKDVNCRSPE
jgi:hypothetical protein